MKPNFELIRFRLREQAEQFANKVAPIYKILKWTWGNKPDAIPTEQEILKTTLDLIEDINEKEYVDIEGEKSMITSTGGITVGFEIDNYTIEFITRMEIDPSDYIFESTKEYVSE